MRPALLRLSELAAQFGCTPAGEDVAVVGVASLTSAGPAHLALYANRRLRGELIASRAGAVVLAPGDRAETDKPCLVTDTPQLCFARLTEFFHPPFAYQPGVHAGAAVDRDAVINPSAAIGVYCHVEAGVEIGAGCVLEAGCFVGRGSRIGAGSHLHAHVTVYHDCVIGARAIIHSGAVIGADGFGLIPHAGGWRKAPQVGRVVLGDDVEVGANTTIDRGALDDTVIGDGVKLDNQIQIGHNCVIGAHTAIAGCAGIAGSARIGRHCQIGGAAMIAGHLEIADGVTVSGGTVVVGSIKEPGVYTSIPPLLPHRDWQRNAVQQRRLGELHDRIKTLERQIAYLEGRLP